MNRRRNDLIQLAILFLLGVSVVLTLLLPQLAQGRSAPPLVSLSVLIRDADSSLWTNARLGMDQAADELGAELRFLTLSAPNDAQEQADLLLREIEGGADTLVVVPADGAALAGTLAGLSDHPVVTLESPVDGAVGLVAPDNARLGRELAQALLEDWTDGTVLLLDTAGPCPGVADRLDAARQVLEQAGVPVAVYGLSPGQTAPALADLLAETGGQWLMAFEPSATQQIADAKAAAGLSVPVYGTGNTTAITAQLERGTIAAIAAWSDYAAGYLAVEQAVAAVRGGGAPPSPLAFSILRREDIYEPDNQKLLFPVTS